MIKHHIVIISDRDRDNFELRVGRTLNEIEHDKYLTLTTQFSVSQSTAYSYHMLIDYTTDE